MEYLEKKRFVRIAGFLLAGIVSFICPFSFATAQEMLPAEEKITLFTTDLSVRSDGSIFVIERIIYDFGQNEKHGIYRTIPLGFKAKGQPDHTRIKVVNVTDEKDIPYAFVVTSKDPLNIKIGDPDEFVTGLHTYVISYLVYSSIGFFDTYDELYWNVTGDAWKVPIESVKATMELPEDISFDALMLAHYCGIKGEKKTCGSFQRREQGGALFSMASDRIVMPGEHVTVAVGFPKGMVPVPGIKDRIVLLLKNYWFIPFPFLIVLLWFRKRLIFWRKRRDYYKTHPIIAEYDPGSFDPLDAAILVNGKTEFKDVTAVIVSLAIRGYLRFDNRDDEILFTKIKSVGAEGKAYENALLDSLHEKRESALDKKFGSAATKGLQSAATSLLAREYFTGKLAGAAVIGKFVPTIIAFFFALNPGMFIWIWLGKGFGIAFSGACVLIGIISLLIKPMVFLTNKGLEAQRKLLGLKRYIEVAEKERITFANAPAKTPELFEKLLPYAMVFHLEKKWAEEFEHIYVTPPSWYGGDMGVFSSLVVIQSIGSISTVTTQAIASSVPSSSRSSWGGSSGSSGSGSSGGGGGGGGGGSW